LIIYSDGNVFVQRKDWNKGVHAGFGTLLNHGDIVSLDNDATSVFLCSDLETIKSLPSGDSAGISNECPGEPNQLLVRGGKLVLPGLGGVSDIPKIVRPRGTYLLDSTGIKLSWLDTKKPPYTVNIEEQNNFTTVWEQKEVSQTTTIYTGTELKPDTTYVLKVSDSNGMSSTKEPAKGLFFKIIPKDEAEQIKQQETKLAETINNTIKQVLPESERFFRAMLAAGQEQQRYAEAIDILEELAISSEQPAVHAELCSLYVDLLLPELADAHCKKALELVEHQKPHILEGALLENQGKIYQLRGNRDAAILSYEMALEWYNAQNDRSGIDRVKNELAGLQ